ncbi:glycosyltransferase family 39 protein [bacterium]|nr:glycosyltransferase family 39 protein [bacterium]
MIQENRLLAWGRRDWRTIGLLAGICALVWIGTAGLWDLRGPDEGRYVQVAKEVGQGRSPFQLTIYGQPYDEKSPLPFWFLAGMLKLSGGKVSTWTLRIPSILFGVLAVVLSFVIGRRLFGYRAGLMAALVLMTTGQVLDDAPKAQLDMMFTGALMIAMAILLTRSREKVIPLARALVMWAALVAATFIKGPLALIIFVSPIIAESIAERSLRPVRETRLLGGVAVLAAGIALVLVMLIHANGLEFILSQIHEQTVERFLNGSHGAPFYFYLTHLCTSIFVPWGILLIPAGIILWRTRGKWPTGMAGIVGWIVIPFIVLSIAHGKRNAYMLPLMPGMALVVGWWLDRAVSEGQRFPRVSFAISILEIVTGGLLFAAAVLAAFRQDLFWSVYFYLRVPNTIAMAGIGIAAVAVGVWSLRHRAHLTHVIYGSVGFVLLLGLANYTIVKPSTDPQSSTRAFAARLASLAQTEGVPPVVAAFDDAAKPEFHVYGDYSVKSYSHFDQAYLDDPDLPQVVVLEEDDRKDVPFDELKANGFIEAFHEVSSSDLLWVFLRDPNAAVEPAKSSIQIAFAGDTAYAEDENSSVQNEVAEYHDVEPIDAYFLLGDILEGDKGFKNVLQDEFLVPFKPVLDRDIETLMVLGNHDQRDGMERDILDFPGFNMQGQDHYAKTFGDDLVTFFVINSERLERHPEQVQWLRTSLANCDSKWKVLLMHHPISASKISHGADRGNARILMPILTGEHDVDFILSGHDHMYERRRVEPGLVQVIVGNGCSTEKEPLPPDPEREAGSTNKVGFAVASITPYLFEVEALDTTGQVYDRATYVDMDDPDDVIELSMN